MAQPRIRRLLRHGTLPQLRAFEAVARLGSFTRAADELNVAQATVSGHIRKLAESAQAPLFEPSGRRVALTPAGRALVSVAGEVFASLERAERDLEALRSGVAGGRLALCAEDGAGFAMRLLARFADEHPRLDLSTRIANRTELARRFAAREADLFLFRDRAPRGAGGEALRTEGLLLCARSDHPLAARRGLRLDCLATRTLLAREPGSSMRAALDRLLRRQRVTPARLIEFSSDDAIRQAAAAGSGIALLPADALESGDARVAALDVAGLPLPQRWVGVIVPGVAPNMAARAFLAVLRANARMARDDGRDAGADAALPRLAA